MAAHALGVSALCDLRLRIRDTQQMLRIVRIERLLVERQQAQLVAQRAQLAQCCCGGGGGGGSSFGLKPRRRVRGRRRRRRLVSLEEASPANRASTARGGRGA